MFRSRPRLWLNFRFQPVPWDQGTNNTWMSFEHDCMFHHQKSLVDGVTPRLHAYDAKVIKARSAELRNQLLNNPTTAQQFLRYEIESEFLAVATENASFEDIYGMLNSWAVLLDKLFFGGHLTQGPEKLINIRLQRFANTLRYGQTMISITPPQMIIDIYLRDQVTGGRYSKWLLFDSLLHEICHAYDKALFNWCPVNHDADVESWADAGHGLIWQHLFYNAIEVVSTTFHPSFAIMGKYPKPVTGEPLPPFVEYDPSFFHFAYRQVYDYYLPVAAEMGMFLDRWFLHLEIHNPMLYSSLLTLRDGTRQGHLLKTLPRMLRVTEFFVISQIVLFCIFAAIIWWYNLVRYRTIDRVIWLVCMDYMWEQNILSLQKLWLYTIGHYSLRLITAAMVVKMYRNLGWLEFGPSSRRFVRKCSTSVANLFIRSPDRERVRQQPPQRGPSTA